MCRRLHGTRGPWISQRGRRCIAMMTGCRQQSQSQWEARLSIQASCPLCDGSSVALQSAVCLVSGCLHGSILLRHDNTITLMVMWVVKPHLLLLHAFAGEIQGENNEGNGEDRPHVIAGPGAILTLDN